MFELAGNGVTKDELAYILYLFSHVTPEAVYGMIEPLFKDGGEL